MSAADASVREIAIRGDSIELARLLKFAGVVDTGGAAKHAVGAGQVTLNGAVEIRRSRAVVPGDRVVCGGVTLVVRSAR